MDKKEQEDENLTMNFMELLNKSSYLEFVIDILNNIASGAIMEPTSVSQVYKLPSTRLEANKNPNSGRYASSYSTI